MGLRRIVILNDTFSDCTDPLCRLCGCKIPVREIHFAIRTNGTTQFVLAAIHFTITNLPTPHFRIIMPHFALATDNFKILICHFISSYFRFTRNVLPIRTMYGVNTPCLLHRLVLLLWICVRDVSLQSKWTYNFCLRFKSYFHYVLQIKF